MSHYSPLPESGSVNVNILAVVIALFIAVGLGFALFCWWLSD